MFFLTTRRPALRPWKDLAVSGVITASEPSWIAPFTGLSPRCINRLKQWRGLAMRTRKFAITSEDASTSQPS